MLRGVSKKDAPGTWPEKVAIASDPGVHLHRQHGQEGSDITNGAE